MRNRHLLWMLCVAAAIPAHSDPVATQTLTLSVRPIASLSVPKTGAITLETAAGGQPDRYQTVRLVQPKGLQIYDNLPGSRRVEAEAILTGARTDLDLTCAIPGRPAATLIKGGAGQGPQAITGDIVNSFQTYDLIWEATATGPGTPAGDYRCDIRFTLTDQ